MRSAAALPLFVDAARLADGAPVAVYYDLGDRDLRLARYTVLSTWVLDQPSEDAWVEILRDEPAAD